MRTERQRNTGSNVLLKRILVTFGLLAFVRMGTFLPVPGIEQSYITFYLQNSPIARFVNTFSNDNFFVLGLFTLNIFPYINASILMQVLISTVPSLRKLQKEEGSFGRRRLNQIIRFICLGWSIIQSTSIAFFLKNILFDWNLITDPSNLVVGYLLRIKSPLQMSPFLLNLNLNPLYPLKSLKSLKSRKLLKIP